MYIGPKNLGIINPSGGSASPSVLFANNEVGVWYDTAGTAGARSAKMYRRNLFSWSQDLSQSDWVAGFVTKTATGFREDTSTNEHLVRQSISGNGSIAFTISCEVQGVNRTWARIVSIDSTFSSACGGFFELSGAGSLGNQTKINGDFGSRSITLLSDGYYRIVISNITHTNTTGIGVIIGAASANGTNSYTGNTANGLNVRNVQIEIGGAATTYQRINNFNEDFLAVYPTHSLYQDSLGTTPAISPGDPVALQLDMSRGGITKLGTELITNGSLATSTGWTVTGAGVAISGGVASWTAATGNISWTAGGLVAGKWYRVELDLVSYTSGSLFFRDGTSNFTIATTGAISGRKSIIFQATMIGISFHSFAAATYSIDNISVREIPGIPRYQTTTANRPVLARIPEGGTRNLLTWTEELSSSVWTKLQCSISANNSTAPDGSSTADLIVENAATAARYVQQSVTTTVQSYTFSMYLKNPTVNGRRYALLYHNESVKGWTFDLQNGVVGAGGTVGVTAPAAYGIQSVGNGWYRCHITITGTAASNQFRVYPLNNDGSGNSSYTGDSVSGILAWGAQVQTGSTVTAYQKVTVNADVTQAGKQDCWGILYNGVDQSFVTQAVNFSATDEMTIWAGIRKLSDAADGIVAELTVGSTDQAWGVNAPGSGAAARFQYYSRGTSSAVPFTASSTYNAPFTTVLNARSEISADTAILRLNGTQVSSVTTDQGTGNYANNSMFFGRRNNTTQPYNGYEFGIIIRGKNTSANQISIFEKWMARRTGITI